MCNSYDYSYLAFAAPMDYDSITITLVFSPGNERQCVFLNSKEDGKAEGMETFTVNLTSTDNVNLVPDMATITIIDVNGE